MQARRARFHPSTVSDALADSLAALRTELDLPEGFPPEVITESEDQARAVAIAPGADIHDLREIEFLTIDPLGSTDLDQALHLVRTGTGAVLHYAIADVPAFVIPGGAVDNEARRRGQTLYAPDGRVPLHPPVLSEDVASLLPERDRLAFVWRFELDSKAEPVSTTLVRAVVRSRRQWTYDEAQKAIDEGNAPESLAALPWFGEQRAERESERGGASLNIPETRIVPGNDGGYALALDAGVPAEDWNAHVSLLTGMAAAKIMLDARVGILRTMPAAPQSAIDEFRAHTVALGMPWREELTYGDYLRSLDRSAVARTVKEHAAALFRGADYVTFDGVIPDETVQAAIGAPYAHTTAPLRRLVDRWVLTICEAVSSGKSVPAWVRESLPEIPRIMSRTSQLASQLESGALDRVEASVLHGREGEAFEALVLRVRGGHTRVQLVDPPIEADVAGLDAPLGTIVPLVLTHADVATGEVTLRSAVAGTSSSSGEQGMAR